ncbi:MAG: methyltransferase domain-containing protein [Planctomycetales bacterium]
MSDPKTNELDESKMEAFGERMLGFINGGALALMASIGHRTGLFDSLAGSKPSTSEQIAEQSGLNERYVREWLGAMVTGGVVEHDAEAGTYSLPPEHAAMLTRAAADNLASVSQWIGVLAGVEDKIIDCFKQGGGVHYGHFHRFHEVMAEESGQTVVAALEEHILPLAPGVCEALEAGADVLDVGCGAGRAITHLAGRFPNSRFTGYDFSDEAIAAGQAEAERQGLSNLNLVVKDVSEIGDRERFDFITAFDAIHDQAKPAKVLSEISQALRPDGTFLMQDIAASSHLHKNMEHPVGPFLYTISCMHCMTVSLAQDGAGLGTVWGEELAVKMLQDAGFGNVDVKTLPHDVMNNYYVAAKN